MKIPMQKSQEVRSIPQNRHESSISIQPFQGVPTTSLQQRRVYSSGFKHVQLKKDLRITSDSQINSIQLSQSSKSSDT